MTGPALHKRISIFLADESGAAMVEFAIVSAVFFLAFLQLFGFGLFASSNLMAEKATQLAARIAVVRPPVCSGIPTRITASDLTPAPRFGTNCRNAAGTCSAPTPSTVSCSGSTLNANDASKTDGEIWLRVRSMLPPDTEITDITFTYAFDPNLGYLGGPYTPMVTVDVAVPNDNSELLSLFQVISALAQNAGSGSGFTAPQYRVISISLPAEDLALGTSG